MASAPTADAGGKAAVTDVRVGDHGSVTRIVLDVSRKVTFDTFTLDRPDRVVIDMSEVAWRPKSLPRGAGVIARIRHGVFKPGTSRVVLDLSQPGAVRDAFLLEPSGSDGYRVVLDLDATSAAAFRKTVRIRHAGTVRATAPKSAASPTKVASAAPGVASAAFASPFLLPPHKPEQHWRKHVVVLDPGHGGIDPGAISKTGVEEKRITLAVAKEVRRRLEATGRYHVVLTRDNDTFVRLRDRIAIARRAKAELFISLHADIIANPHIRGLSVYTLSERASDKEAAALAESENKADLIAGVDLSDETPEVTNILIDLAQRETMNQSARFASLLVDELKPETRLLRHTHRFAGFVVLKAPDVPSVLIETGFLSNRHDEKALQNPHYRANLAQAIERAVDDYFEQVEQARRQ